VRKDAARAVLEAFDPAAVDHWAEGEQQAMALLQSLLFEEDPLLRWRAVEASGRVAAVLSRRDLEPAREAVRRALWLMNDESGGLLWNGPELIGAVLGNVPPLRREFTEILASFLEEEPFRAGTRWGLWRVAAVEPGAVTSSAQALVASLGDPDPEVRGLAALALSATRGPAATAALAGDGARLVVFDFRTAVTRETTVGEVAGGGF
jgi:hypothetical protein